VGSLVPGLLYRFRHGARLQLACLDTSLYSGQGRSTANFRHRNSNSGMSIKLSRSALSLVVASGIRAFSSAANPNKFALFAKQIM
jgi:hypothetical protein